MIATQHGFDVIVTYFPPTLIKIPNCYYKFTCVPSSSIPDATNNTNTTLWETLL